MRKIKVLIIDDSAVTRKFLTEALSISKKIEVVATALDPFFAVEKIKKYEPDVLTLDIEMPNMDGLTFLSKLMIAHPMPVIMASAYTDAGAQETLKALQMGAVDFILKPSIEDEASWKDFSAELVEKIIAASTARIVKKVPSDLSVKLFETEKHSADVIIPPRKISGKKSTPTIIAIGASAGGTEVIAEILRNIPEDSPGMVIVQHMPEKFTLAFAERVNRISRLQVKEAADGDRVDRGIALIAPGDHHMLLKGIEKEYAVEINNGLPVNRHRPSVDVLFRSTAQVAGHNGIGILLTGMGSDGAKGLLEMKEAGARTIAQDKKSSVVFGMPKEAIKLGAAEMIKNIPEIIQFIINLKE